MNLTLWAYKKISAVVEKQKISNNNPKNLTIAFCLGVYIAFSPFVGFHTIAGIVLSWIFKLNMPLVFLGILINNPWTMLPIYSLDYGFGYYTLHTLLGINLNWGVSIESFYDMSSQLLNTWFGLNFNGIIHLNNSFCSCKICLVSFLIGGNILGVLAATISYPIFLKIFKNILKQKGQTAS